MHEKKNLTSFQFTPKSVIIFVAHKSDTTAFTFKWSSPLTTTEIPMLICIWDVFVSKKHKWHKTRMCFNLVCIGCYGARKVNQLGLLICNKQADVWPSLHSHRKMTMHTCCYTASIKRILWTEHNWREWNFAYFSNWNRYAMQCNGSFLKLKSRNCLANSIDVVIIWSRSNSMQQTGVYVYVYCQGKKHCPFQDPWNVSHVTTHQIRINGYFLLPGKKEWLFEEKTKQRIKPYQKNGIFICADAIQR